MNERKLVGCIVFLIIIAIETASITWNWGCKVEFDWVLFSMLVISIITALGLILNDDVEDKSDEEEFT